MANKQRNQNGHAAAYACSVVKHFSRKPKAAARVTNAYRIVKRRGVAGCEAAAWAVLRAVGVADGMFFRCISMRRPLLLAPNENISRHTFNRLLFSIVFKFTNAIHSANIADNPSSGVSDLELRLSIR
ncbi:hypothetical protein EN871_24635 [bacterium M00.F.Ca.ET.228.01.1.1]|nr:hypothetical protein EN871_24635 [bacterium M00.F.Ca.ET.228.01.1.1]TGR97779.1 hypothetical protein EN834_24250 [bacterium M00.F.Ca.ET.191.01.1.1]TGU01946.1 hypothetical protein EN798_25070 [bacterium M00.F.Ca.ET.155.01.1.1]